MEQTSFAHQKIGELVAQDYRLAAVFKRHGIDFCCGGGRSVQDACLRKGIVVEQLEQELTEALQERDSSGVNAAAHWELDFLADYIVNVHHRYVRNTLPPLLEFTRKVAQVHGHANPEVEKIAELFAELASEMDSHMRKEEMILFPHVKKLVEARRNGLHFEQPSFGTVRNPITMMEHEHDHAGTLMRTIGGLSNEFTPPEYACNTYRVAYAMLQEFEEDLHRHVHLENNVLFPKATHLEAQLNQN